MMNEEKFLSPGDSKGIFDFSFGKACTIICYNLRFTKLSRSLALNGCQAMFVPAQWPSIRGRHWVTLNMARAIENQRFVIAVNRVGYDSNNKFFGYSLVVNPWGEIIAEGSETDEVIVAEVDFSMVDKIRKQIAVFADRRPQYY